MWGLRAQRLFDGERFVARPTLLVDEGRVVAVGAPVPESVPTVDLTVDLGADTVLPGLVDCHQHLVFDGNGTLEQQVAGRTETELADRARTHARRALAGGVTTLRDLGDRGYVTLDLRDDPTLPTIRAAGPPITPPGGHCWYLGGEVAAGETELRQAVRDRVERGCDLVKVMVTGGALTPSHPVWKSQFSAEEVRAVVDEAHRHGRPVAAHCHGIEGITMALEAGADSIEHCSFVDESMRCAPTPDLLARLARAGIALSVTWGLTGPAPAGTAWDEIRPIARRAVGRVHEHGGVVVVGTDAGISPLKPHDVLRYSLTTFVEDAGMTALDGLRAITSVAGRVCAVPDGGRLVAGGPADVIAVGGDPLADPTALVDVRAVWKAGVRVTTAASSDRGPASSAASRPPGRAGRAAAP